MANPELGAKQICPNCQAKFYDLTKRPAHCPKCDTEFDPEEAVRNRRVRARAIAPEPRGRGGSATIRSKADAEAEDEDEEEEVVTPELDEVVDEPVAGRRRRRRAPSRRPPSAEDLGDFTDEEEVEDDADVPFLEDDDDDEFDETRSKACRTRATSTTGRRPQRAQARGEKAQSAGLIAPGCLNRFRAFLRTRRFHGKTRDPSRETWGYSSAGRALAWHSRGQRFDSA